MHNEFTLVKSKRSKRRKQIKSISNYKSHSGDVFDGIKLKRKLTGIIEKFPADHFIVEFISNIRSTLSKLEKTRIDVILCYGLGKFSESPSSLHQLAFLIILQTQFEAAVEVFDPVFNLCEIDFLKTFNFLVIENNEEGKRVIDEDKLTLVYLPHCPKQLINNFLWANWNQKLTNCIVISNSFSQILVNNTKRTISDSAGYISKCYPFCEEIPVKDNYDYPNVFNDTSIHFFHKPAANQTIFDLPAEEPKYAEDTELITKEIESLEL